MINVLPTIVLSLATIGLLSAVYTKGYQSGFLEANTDALIQHADELQLIFLESEEFQKKMESLDLSYTTQQIKLRDEISNLKTKVTLYEQTKQNNCVVFDNEWVYMHDTAARLSGTTNPIPPSLDDGSSQATKNTGKISTIVDNYSTCALYIEQLEALQDYVKLYLSQ